MVSIIIPTYHRDSSLKRAIDSCMRQTYKNIEIIVVDDNDPDSTYRSKVEDIMKSYSLISRIHYYKHEKNKKGSAARNTGILAAKGDFITFLDDDDVLESDKISKQVGALNAVNDSYGMVLCGVRVCDELSNKLMRVIHPKKSTLPQYELLKLRLGIGTGSNPMFRKSVVEDVGLFDVSFVRHQDLEYITRVLRNYNCTVIDDILVTKYESGHVNRPDANVYLHIHQHYLDTFKKDILSYSPERQAEIYRNQWHQMCIVAIDDRNWKLAYSSFKTATSYMKYSIRMILGIIKHILCSRF